MVADVAAFDEVGAEHRLHRRVLHAVLPGEPDQPVRVDRVRRPRHQIGAERQADGRRRLGDPLIQRRRLLRAAELPGAIGGAVAALLRHVGIELERVPVHREAQPLLRQRRQRALQLALADIAPRADRVGDDVDPRPGPAASESPSAWPAHLTRPRRTPPPRHMIVHSRSPSASTWSGLQPCHGGWLGFPARRLTCRCANRSSTQEETMAYPPKQWPTSANSANCSPT